MWKQSTTLTLPGDTQDLPVTIVPIMKLSAFQLCCPPEFLYAPKTNAVDPYTLLPSTRDCGIQNNDRIVGGVQTDIDEHPWMALLRYDKREPSNLAVSYQRTVHVFILLGLRNMLGTKIFV